MTQDDDSCFVQKKNVGWESGQQKRASHNLPELKESLQLKWHDMDTKWPSDQDIDGFQAFSKVGSSRVFRLVTFLLTSHILMAQTAATSRHIPWHTAVS